MENPLTKKQLSLKQDSEAFSYSRNYESSPPFAFANDEITAGSQQLFSFFDLKPAMEKYGAMNTLTINNNSGIEISIYLNQDLNRELIVPAGVSSVFDRQDLGGGIYSLIIKNNDSSTTASANTIKFVTFKKGITSEQVFENAHKSIFERFFLK